MRSISFERSPRVDARFGWCKSTRHNRIAAGLFVSPIALGGRAVGYPTHEIDAIAAAMLASKSDDEIRALVRRLEAERKNADQALEAA